MRDCQTNEFTHFSPFLHLHNNLRQMNPTQRTGERDERKWEKEGDRTEKVICFILQTNEIFYNEACSKLKISS